MCTCTQDIQALLNALEALLVREFRATQALVHLASVHRSALATGDASRILAISIQKADLLQSTGQLEGSKMVILHQLLSQDAPASPDPGSAVMNASFTTIHTKSIYRVAILQQGTVALKDQARHLWHGNHALAAFLQGCQEAFPQARATTLD